MLPMPGWTAYIGREVGGDRNGAGDVGESEYGENADMRVRSGEGSKGDCNAIIVARTSRRPWEYAGQVSYRLMRGKLWGRLKEVAEMMYEGYERASAGSSVVW